MNDMATKFIEKLTDYISEYKIISNIFDEKDIGKAELDEAINSIIESSSFLVRNMEGDILYEGYTENPDFILFVVSILKHSTKGNLYNIIEAAEKDPERAREARIGDTNGNWFTILNDSVAFNPSLEKSMKKYFQIVKLIDSDYSYDDNFYKLSKTGIKNLSEYAKYISKSSKYFNDVVELKSSFERRAR